MKLMVMIITKYWSNPAAFRRLCVETILGFNISSVRFPAAFRRLCVETIFLVWIKGHAVSSRLQAAVC